MAYSFQVVEDKLLEAEFFLKQLGTTSSLDTEARYYFSAFVSASRSVTFALQKSLKGIDGFDGWYKSIREQLQTDPLVPYFCETRNQIVHTGINPLNQVNAKHLRDFISRQLRTVMDIKLSTAPGRSPFSTVSGAWHVAR